MAAIWINDDYWACTSHMRAVRLPASADACWYAGCHSHRPQRDAGDDPTHSAHAERHQTRLERGERSLHSDAVSPEELLERAEAAEEARRRMMAPEVDEGPQLPGCEWVKCDQPARPGSKYCSRECSNKNARARYLKRQRNKPATRPAPDTQVAASSAA